MAQVIVPHITAFDVELREALRAIEIALNKPPPTGGGGGGVTDHGDLTGLGGDDHPQYLTEARGDARYLQAASLGYVHNQGVASSAWTIDHNLGFIPNVTVEDSAGTTVEGEIVFTSAFQLTITFSAAFSGVAYLS